MSSDNPESSPEHNNSLIVPLDKAIPGRFIGSTRDRYPESLYKPPTHWKNQLKLVNLYLQHRPEDPELLSLKDDLVAYLDFTQGPFAYKNYLNYLADKERQDALQAESGFVTQFSQLSVSSPKASTSSAAVTQRRPTRSNTDLSNFKPKLPPGSVEKEVRKRNQFKFSTNVVTNRFIISSPAAWDFQTLPSRPQIERAYSALEEYSLRKQRDLRADSFGTFRTLIENFIRAHRRNPENPKTFEFSLDEETEETEADPHLLQGAYIASPQPFTTQQSRREQAEGQAPNTPVIEEETTSSHTESLNFGFCDSGDETLLNSPNDTEREVADGESDDEAEASRVTLESSDESEIGIFHSAFDSVLETTPYTTTNTTTYTVSTGGPGDPGDPNPDSSDEENPQDNEPKSSGGQGSNTSGGNNGTNNTGGSGNSPGNKQGSNPQNPPGGGQGDNTGGQGSGSGGQNPGGGNNNPPHTQPQGSPIRHQTTMVDAHRIALRAIGRVLTDIAERINEHNDKDTDIFMTLGECDFQKDTLNTLRSGLFDLQKSCFSNFQDRPGTPVGGTGKVEDQTEALKQYDILYTTYQECQIHLNNIREALAKVTEARIKPPKPSTPTFSGKVSEWISFHEMFEKNIVAVGGFSNIEKLEFLKQALKEGSAWELVRDLPLTALNFTVGYNLLKKRYESEIQLLHHVCQPIGSFTPLISHLASEIRKVLDVVRAFQTNIDRLKTKDISPMDLFLQEWIVKHVDHKSAALFHQQLSNQKLTKLADTFEFFETLASNLSCTREVRDSNSHPHSKQVRINAHVKKGNRKKNGNNTSGNETDDATSAQSGNETDTSAGTSSGSKKKKKKRKKLLAIKNQNQRASSPHPGQSTQTQQQSSQRKNSYPCVICKNDSHNLRKCQEFLKMSIPQRKQVVGQNKMCFNCFGPHTQRECKSRFSCSGCGKRHNSLLHQNSTTVNVIGSEENWRSTPQPFYPIQYQHHPAQGINHTKPKMCEEGILPTAIIRIYINKQFYPVRALLDSGSQTSFIRSDVVHRLNLPIQRTDQAFIAAGNKSLGCLGKTRFEFYSKLDNRKAYSVECFILDIITTNTPLQRIEVNNWKHIKSIPLADETFNIPRSVDILLGTSIFDKIFKGIKISGGDQRPGAHETSLGYIIFGAVNQRCSSGRQTNVINSPAYDELNKTITKFLGETEAFPKERDTPHYTPDEQRAEDLFAATTIRTETGQYEVELPLVENPPLLGDNEVQSTYRWFRQEKILETPGKEFIKKPYHDTFQEYLDENQLELVPEEELKNPRKDGLIYVLPHHPVIKESSTTTKVRVVYDASMRTSTGVSLNDILLPGPVLTANLFDCLLRFRLYKIAFSADVRAMFRCILVNPKYRDLMRIVYRKSPTEPLRIYRMRICAFGLNPSPFLANRVIKQLAKDCQVTHPVASTILEQLVYVDDIPYSIPTISTAMEAQNQLIDACAGAHFQLRKWISNADELLQNVPASYRELSTSLSFDSSDSVKTLGVRWLPGPDYFTFVIVVDLVTHHTMRSLLSQIAKIFDPMGFLTPVVILLKCLMQGTWNLKLSWNDKVPDDIQQKWLSVARQLHLLANLRIPRWLGFDLQGKFEIHAFGDASALAFAGCVYLRGIWPNKIQCRLIAAKSRVAPMKTLTIPRLELAACLLLADLTTHIVKTLAIILHAVYYYSDSTVALSWIHAHPSKWRQFVANRVAQIQEKTTPAQWSHIETEKNPADIASRGNLPSVFMATEYWFNGPQMLYNPNYKFTKKVVNTVIPEPQHELLDRLLKLSWPRATRTLGFIKRIAQVARGEKHLSRLLSPLELWEAEKGIVHLIQQQVYKDEIRLINKNQSHKIKDRFFRQLDPYLDAQGNVRAGGRIGNADLPYDMKHPLILPGTHPMTRQLIQHTHELLAHAQKNIIVHHLSQRFWITNASKASKRVINHCLLCFCFKAKAMEQKMADLPAVRLLPCRPFLKTGVDLGGPYNLKGFLRSKAKMNAYICVFSCLVTRAIHLEILTSLSTPCFLLALRRFISRRGRPSHLYSDNGTNFRGAANILDHALPTVDDLQRHKEQYLPSLEICRIKWIFLPPRAPHMGGTWEAHIKLVKDHLRKILLQHLLNYEEFYSILTFVEAMINLRPLTAMSTDPNDLRALTPMDFLILDHFHNQTHPNMEHVSMKLLEHHQVLLSVAKELWKRWQKEYLTSLQMHIFNAVNSVLIHAFF